MDSTEAANVIRQNHEMAKSLAENAKKQDANLKDEPEPEKLPAIEGLVDTAEVIETTQTKAGHAWGGAGTAVSYRSPNIQFSSPAGIFWGTPREAYLYSEKTSSLTANEDVNIAAKGQSSIGAAEGIALYAVGEEAKGEDPIKETGIRLHAAHGDTEVRSLEAPTKLASESTMTLASTENNVLIHAPEHVLFNAGGAELKLTPTNIQLYAPGNVTFKASKHVFMGPKTYGLKFKLPKSTFEPLKIPDQAIFILSSHPHGEGLLYKNEPYKLYKDGAVIKEDVSDDHATIVYEREEGAKYHVETLSGHLFDIPQEEEAPKAAAEALKEPEGNKDAPVAKTLGQFGHRYWSETREEAQGIEGIIEDLDHRSTDKPE
jgi:uncharacterized protein (DUF2345 family)